jgi:radical SAM protein with 4Fe4S-binding SPASM domain
MSEFEKRLILGKLSEAFNLIGLKEQEALQIAHDMLNVYLQQKHQKHQQPQQPTDFKDCMECKHAPCHFQSCPYAWYEHKQRRVTKK